MHEISETDLFYNIGHVSSKRPRSDSSYSTNTTLTASESIAFRKTQDSDNDFVFDTDSTSLIDDFMDEFIQYDHKRQSPWVTEGAPEKPFLSADAYLLSVQMTRQVSDFEDLPLRLQFDQGHLFPEIYFCFRTQFSAISIQHRQYCKRTAAGFKGCFIGKEEDIEAMLSAMDSEFSHAFMRCLDPSDEALMDLASNWFLSKSGVEQKFLPALIKVANPYHALVRGNELTIKAIGGDVEPLIISLRAAHRSDNDIWMQICPLLLKHCRTHEQLMEFEEEMKAAMQNKGKIVEDMRDFVTILISKGLFFKNSKDAKKAALIPAQAVLTPKTSIVPKQPKNFPQKVNKKKEQRIKPDGSMWLPKKEYYKQRNMLRRAAQEDKNHTYPRRDSNHTYPRRDNNDREFQPSNGAATSGITKPPTDRLSLNRFLEDQFISGHVPHTNAGFKPEN